MQSTLTHDRPLSRQAKLAEIACVFTSLGYTAPEMASDPDPLFREMAAALEAAPS
jgi:hypothetical protein